MNKQEIKEAMIGLVRETIIPAIYEDCGVEFLETSENFDYAIKVLISELNKQKG